jgi:hypothetical protein
LVVDDLDRHAYLARLTAAVHRFGVGRPGLLPHGHARPPARPRPSATLARAVQDVHGGYARAFNDRHDRTGTPVEGRYKARPVLADDHLHACLRYLAHNPVAAGLCRPRPTGRGAAYRALAGECAPLPFHATDETLRLLAPTPAAARRAFLAITTKP